MVHRRPVYIYLFNVPSFSSRHFNKIKRTSRLGRLLALSLEILSLQKYELVVAKCKAGCFEVADNLNPPPFPLLSRVSCCKIITGLFWAALFAYVSRKRR